jgi:hypothetical protein
MATPEVIAKRITLIAQYLQLLLTQRDNPILVFVYRLFTHVLSSHTVL